MNQSVIVARRLEDVHPSLTGIVITGLKSLNEARNIGAAKATSDYIAFIDDDNLLDSQALDEMEKGFDDRAVGAVSPVIFDNTGGVWFAGATWDAFGMATIDKTVPKCLRATESFHDVFMVRRSAFLEVGGFDSERFPFYLGEADLAERMKALGYRFVVAPRAMVWHDIAPVTGLGSVLRGSHIRDKKRAYLVGRNRLLFLRLHHPGKFRLHLFVLPILAFVHILGMATDRKTGFIKPYLKGVRDGLR